MTSILTNSSAMNALATLRNTNSNLNTTQDRISSGLKIQSGKDNAAYFSISETMKGDSGMTKSINDGLTLTKNVISTGRLGAETMTSLAQEFTDRVAFAQAEGVDKAEVQKELDELVKRMTAAISQSTFNGTSVVSGSSNALMTVDGARYDANTDTSNQSGGTYTTAADTDIKSTVTGTSRSTGSFATTTIDFKQVDLTSIKDAFDRIDLTAAPADTVKGIKGQAAFAAGTDDALAYNLATAELALGMAISAATDLGVAEKTIETQQDFLTALSDRLDSGIGSMVDADMEEEAARLQALQVQQQLSTQALSIANQAPQNILSLFR